MTTPNDKERERHLQMVQDEGYSIGVAHALLPLLSAVRAEERAAVRKEVIDELDAQQSIECNHVLKRLARKWALK